MTTMQVGQRLVRNFGSCSNLKTVITETVDGKVYTKVLDENGKIFKERVKAFTEQNVGNKLVKTKTIVESNFKGDKYKKVLDRVYNGDTFWGKRIENYRGINPFGTYEWIKERSSITTNGANVLVKKFCTYEGCCASKKKNGYSFTCNNLGLPSPERSIIETKNKSLQEMVKAHYIAHPDREYLPKESGLAYLNNRTKDMPKLNDLDRYL